MSQDDSVSGPRHPGRLGAAAVAALVVAVPAAAAPVRGPEVRTSVPCPDDSAFELHVARSDGGVPSGFRRPWLEIDFTEEPERYLWSVLESALDENDTLPWSRPRWWEEEGNPNRDWYHVPWLDSGDYGRECRNGLTRERSSRPGELHDRQVDRFQNWGVAMYNAVGARTLARVWFDGENHVPNPAKARFDLGTVAVKVLFTEASADQVPHLDGAPVWPARIHAAEADLEGPRVERELRLVQVDVAVRDARSPEPFGWVFGSFAYDGTLHERMLDEADREDLPSCLWAAKDAREAASAAGETVPSAGRRKAPAPGVEPAAAEDRKTVSCRGLVPIGIMWGDDDGKLWKDLDKGRAHLCETRIFENRVGQPRYLGWGGRLNGPVDSALSSCLQCHRIAEFPRRREMTPDRAWLFESLFPPPPVAGDLATHDLGFSLQLALGLENYCMAGEEAKWKHPWPPKARELCGPYKEVREELAKLSAKADQTEEEKGAALLRLSRETRIGTLEALRQADLRVRRTIVFLVGLGIGVAGVLALGGAGYTGRRLWKRRRRNRSPGQP